ncbi:GNAT family N-acetyltransferase [Streptomyces sp. WELS2]|uniref:GNAT family N-acetyltransferase n=1 Tax=Streptomyces sp. WELS2 TaxID=2749435 RepID=UPI0015F05A53|nr:GNAT family N-acetyltransferase [Streptomyces sp. WELS2]
MIIRAAQEQDLPGFLGLAAQVEHWFGPMVADPGFTRAVRESIGAGTALVASEESSSGLLGAVLFGAAPPVHHVHWLVVSDGARGRGVGSALLGDAFRRWVRGPATVEVVTFGADHPGAVASGARVFYERLGFTPAEPAAPGPEGGSRQVYRRDVP